MKLSIIVVVYNMQRAAPKTVRSLLPEYQRDIAGEDYEIIVVENGSGSPLSEAAICSFGKNIRYYFLENPPPSPAYAINFGVSKAQGDVLSIMIDGAHMLTPGVLSHALQMFEALANPIVVTLPFFLGPGPQTETIQQGYNEAQEDSLLESIAWPEEGYRLFEIGTPFRIEPGGIRPKQLWLVRQFESNCLFMRRESFDRVGGCDERFDIPGGGILIPDLYRQLSRLDDAELVQLMGEGSFHQLHGGTTTNVSRSEQKEKWQGYLRQYESVRGEPFEVSKKPIRYYGHFPNREAMQLMQKG